MTIAIWKVNINWCRRNQWNPQNASKKLNPHEKETILNDLYGKHGQTPLVQLVRRLVVAIDKTGLGTEHRRQTITLLEVLTGQSNIPSNSSAWIDWVESNGENLEWEHLLKSISAKKEDSAPRRLSVEIPEEPKGESRARPMTKEQLIWDEALRRSEKTNWKPSLTVLLIIIPSLICGLGYWGYKKNGFTIPTQWSFSMDLFNQSASSTKSGDVAQNSPTPAEVYWGYFQSTQNPLPEGSYKDYLNESMSLYPHLSRSQLSNWPKQAQLSVQQKLWTKLLIQEHTFASPLASSSPTSFSIRSLGTSQQQWTIERKSLNSKHQSFFQSEDIQLSESKVEMSIKRASGQDGVAHRLILNSKGLLAWSWRLKWQGLVLDGQLIRRAHPDRFSIKTTLPTREISFQIPIESSQVYLPALFSPSLQSFSEVPLVHPISGIISSSQSFNRNVKYERDMETGQLNLIDPSLHWQEAWTPKQP